ncbi:hypothetical protein HL658_31250 [Azospirillum sp. RWY-5-1]|uniref:Uncharacterized protein n=1 Tax=Azospirillum oleiclasticum TaxID=2735135 RepID=A0ABX2TMD9_9PROT|nr:hypothetical protein [Azospirillum oleiclasticum]NYZ17042.1 hypothetical protein [Azospirillum oleiclasticum]NYZ24514.1 hypothetical protein [Azospirillum oleiclasticum]
MAKAPTDNAVIDAFKHAVAGRGGPLARLVKGFSTDDLAAAFARHPVDLILALSFATGRKQERERIADEVREYRRKLRQERRS